jgi:hypothetical protein
LGGVAGAGFEFEPVAADGIGVVVEADGVAGVGVGVEFWFCEV